MNYSKKRYILFAFLLFVTSITLSAQSGDDSISIKHNGAPVFLNNKTLFYVFVYSGSFSPTERAVAITKKINTISESLFFSKDSIIVNCEEHFCNVSCGKTIIISISEKDAACVKTTPEQLAQKYRIIIANAVESSRDTSKLSSILLYIGLILIVLMGLYVFVRLIKKLFTYTRFKIIQNRDNFFRGIRIRNYEIFTASRQVSILLALNNSLKWLTILVFIYLSLPVIFYILPWTQGIADILFGFIFKPLKSICVAIWQYLPNFFTILVVCFVFRYIFKGLRFLKKEIENESLRIPGFYADWANPTYQIARVLVFAFMLVIIFPYLPGSDSTIFKGVSVFFGFLFTFGSAGSLSNIIAGVILTYMRSFSIGDRIKIGDVIGDVIGKTLLVTRIKTIKNEHISIPNSTVMNSQIVNYSSFAGDIGLILNTTVTIGYDVPWKIMHQALIDAALRTNHIKTHPIPFVLQTSLDDFYVSYQLNAYTQEANAQAEIYSNLHQNIQDVCNERGIEILSPHYRASRDGNSSTIPANYLPDNYSAPSFNVTVKKDIHVKS